MTSDLSIFAARLRDFISICTDEPAYFSGAADPDWRGHADAEFNGMALVLFALQFARNPAYRKICEAKNVFPDSVTHWTRIPAVPAAAFKELDLSCLPAAERTAVFHSSGTTEQRPSRHFHSPESLAIYQSSLWPWFRRHLLPELTLDAGLALLTPAPDRARHSSLVYMFETIRMSAFERPPGLAPRVEGNPNHYFAAEVLRDGAWVLNFEKCLFALRHSGGSGQPLILLGTAFSFVHLLDLLAQESLQFQLPPGSRAMETGGYKGRARPLARAELHTLVTERLGIPPTHIVCEYGMTELSSQAYDARIPTEANAGRTFRFPPWARAQIISPETGREAAGDEAGLIRVFDLANVFSVLALQTEDLAVRAGDGFKLIGRAELAEPRGCSLMNQDA